MSEALVFDFGHGGTDGGSTWYDGSYEKNYNLELGLKVIKIIDKYYKNYMVIRTNDIYLSLEDRAKIANKYAQKFDHIDLYSFHTNAFNKKNRGIEICISIGNNIDSDWCNYFMKKYSNNFKIPVRGIVKRESEKNPGKDYYGIIRMTDKKIKSKIIEFGFGDNKEDGKILKANINEIALFIASNILERYGIIIKDSDKKKEWDDILKEVSEYSDIWIEFVRKNHSANLNLKGLVEKLYYTKPK